MEFVYYFFHYYWPVFFMSCSSLFLIMFFLIHNFTTPLLKPLRFFLYPANAVMMISITMAFVIQSRTVGNKQSTALLCDGPCKYIGPNFCLHCYHLWRAFGITACVINLHTMYYRTMCLVHLDSKKAHRWTLLYSVHYIFPFSSQILMLTAPSNHAAVHNETLILHPEYDYTPYLDFGGFDPTEVVYQARNWMFTIATFYSPVIGSYWKHQAMKMLKVHMSPQTSPASRVMLRTLMKGLNFQILLPMISYVPQQLAYLYKQVSGQEFPYSQYAGTFLGTLPCLLDPMVQIYFITPYQNAVRRFLECKTLPRGSPSYSWASRVVTS
ncbi:Serpentine Receptor, class D (Delta) [Caenorhabditis elegans]|uniref:Serpentine Receptor, class D (Delta) n=1 Tax=Caenorhabditis elegans TaxID=6239 RepID=Q9N5W4_CAEEL|nr:Serpentine Receptor, class D (Delta) [Caenorhabditis elegans]CCD67055.1 Serpentine Receptor, class D (Delta) [Caenorhabditis elegans]|eukprot:NP_497521.1 Serpentine Receptor, class D (delta) [Caenorhabditis elegans]